MSRRLLVPLLLALAVLVFFHRPLFTRDRHIHWDSLTLHYPLLHEASLAFREGRIPLWTTRIYCGLPLLAQMQGAVLYPAHLAAFLRGPVAPEGVKLLAILHFAIAVLAAYELARRRLGPPAAAVSALAYGLSGPMLSRASHLGMLEQYALLPLMLSLLSAGFASGRAALALLAGATAALGALAGHFQCTLYAFTFSVAWILAQPFVSNALPGCRRATSRSLLLLALYALATGTLASVQAIPTAELALQSGRKSIHEELARTEPLAPKSIVTAFIPNAFGGIRDLYWGAWDRTNQQCYAGLITLLLAMLALLPPRSRHDVFLAATVVATVLFSLGERTPVHAWANRILPGWDLVRTPSAILPVTYLALSLLAGRGAALLLDRSTPFPWRRFWTCLAALAVTTAAVATWLAEESRRNAPGRAAPRPWLGAVTTILVLAAIPVIVALVRQPRASKAAWLLPALLYLDLSIAYRDSTLSFGRDDPAAILSSGAVRKELERRFPRDGLARVLPWPYGPGFFANEGILKGYDTTIGRVSGLFIAEVGDLLALAKCHRQIMDLLRVRYMVRGRPPGTRMLKSWPMNCPEWNPDEVLERIAPDVYRNPRARPFATAVTEWVVEPEKAERLDRITRIDLDRVAILESPPELAAPPGEAAVSLVSYEPHRLRLRSRASSPALLVASDSFYPGWRADVDGEPVAIMRADHALRAVSVPAGEHLLTMTFHPVSYRVGLFVSLVGLLGCLVAVQGFAPPRLESVILMV